MSRRILPVLVVAILTVGTALDAAADCEGTWCICEDDRESGCEEDDDVVIINDPITAIIIIGTKILEDPEGAADAVRDAKKRAWEEAKYIAGEISECLEDGASWVWDKINGAPPPSPVFSDGSRTVEEYGDRQYVAVRDDYLQTFNDELEISIDAARERTQANEREIVASLPEMEVPEAPVVPDSWDVGDGCISSPCDDDSDDGSEVDPEDGNDTETPSRPQPQEFDLATPRNTPQWDNLVNAHRYHQEASSYVASLGDNYSPQRTALLDASDLMLGAADTAYAGGFTQDGDAFLETALSAIDFAIDFVPGASFVKDAVSLVTGVNPITGEELSATERAFTAATIFVPSAVSGTAKSVAKAAKVLSNVAEAGGSGSKVASKILGTIRRSEDAVSDVLEVLPCTP